MSCRESAMVKMGGASYFACLVAPFLWQGHPFCRMIALMLRPLLGGILLCLGSSCSKELSSSLQSENVNASVKVRPRSKASTDWGVPRPRADKSPDAKLEGSSAKPKAAKPKMPGTAQRPEPIKRGDFYVYSRGEGAWVSGKLWEHAWPFRPEGYAVVWGPSQFILIDRKEKELGYVYSFDNYPDSVQDGLIRMQEGAKVRYFSLKDGVFLKGAWDYGTPFDQGVACVCNDCLHPSGDYRKVKGGKSWFINDKGKILRSYTNPIPQCDLRHRADTKEW